MGGGLGAREATAVEAASICVLLAVAELTDAIIVRRHAELRLLRRAPVATVRLEATAVLAPRRPPPRERRNHPRRLLKLIGTLGTCPLRGRPEATARSCAATPSTVTSSPSPVTRALPMGDGTLLLVLYGRWGCQEVQARGHHALFFAIAAVCRYCQVVRCLQGVFLFPLFSTLFFCEGLC